MVPSPIAESTAFSDALQLRTRLTKLDGCAAVRIAVVNSDTFSDSGRPIHGFVENRTIFSAEYDDTNSDEQRRNLVHLHFIQMQLLESLRVPADLYDPELVLRDRRVRVNQLLLGLLFPCLANSEEELCVVVMPDMSWDDFQQVLGGFFEENEQVVDTEWVNVDDDGGGEGFVPEETTKPKVKFIFLNLIQNFKPGAKLEWKKDYCKGQCRYLLYLTINCFNYLPGSALNLPS